MKRLVNTAAAGGGGGVGVVWCGIVLISVYQKSLPHIV